MILFIFTILLRMIRCCPVILHVLQAMVISHRATALWTKYAVHNFGMYNPNLLNCLIFTRNTHPLSSTLHLVINLPPSFSPLPLLPYISLSYSIPLSSFFPLSLPHFSLSPSLSILPSLCLPPHPSLSPSRPSHILPAPYFASSFLPARSILSQSYNALLFLFLYLPLPLYSFLLLYSPPSLPCSF